MSRLEAAEFAAVPATARLEDCTPGTLVYQAATALYDKYRLSNIGPAKRSKLLHLKRPWLVPIADTPASGRPCSGPNCSTTRRSGRSGRFMVSRARTCRFPLTSRRRYPNEPPRGW